MSDLDLLCHDISNLKITETPRSPSFSMTGPSLWTFAKGYSYVKYMVRKQSFEYPYSSLDVSKVDAEDRYNMRKFLFALDAYKETTDTMDPRDIFCESMLKGPEYCKFLKKVKFYSFVRASGGIPHSDMPIKEKDLINVRFDIGKVFNYRYLFNWKEESNDFMENCFSEDKCVLPNNFKQALLEFLPEFDVSTIPDVRESFFRMSASSSFYNGRSIANFLAKKDCDPYLAPRMEKSKLVKIQKTPGDSREIFLVPPNSLHTIQHIDAVVKSILNHVEGNMMIKNKEEFQRRILRFGVDLDDPVYYYRDIKKEGLTKPRKLLKAMLECINEKYGIRLPPYFFDEIIVEYEGRTYYPTKGTGLGMTNSLTTLLHLFLAHYICNNPQSFTTISGKFLCLNDDFVACFASQEEADSFIEEEDYLFQQLDIPLSKEKCFTSEMAFIFCENYFYDGQFFEKRSIENFITKVPFFVGNIVMAKQIVSSLNLDFDQICKYRNFWGYEFFPEEHYLPYTLGGWKSPMERGIDLTLVSYDEYYRVYSKAYQAIKNSHVYPTKRKIREVLPSDLSELIQPKFAAQFNLSQTEKEMFLFKSTRQWMEKSFYKSPEELGIYYERLEKLRFKNFQKAQSLSEVAFEKMYFEEEPNVYPGKYIKTYNSPLGEGVVIPTFGLESPNPNLDMLCFLRKIPYTRSVWPNPFALKVPKDSEFKNLGAVRNTFSLYSTTSEIETIPANIPDEFCTSYENPIMMAAIMYKRELFLRIPDPTYKNHNFPENLVINVLRSKGAFCRAGLFFYYEFPEILDIDPEILLDILKEMAPKPPPEDEDVEDPEVQDLLSHLIETAELVLDDEIDYTEKVDIQRNYHYLSSNPPETWEDPDERKRFYSGRSIEQILARKFKKSTKTITQVLEDFKEEIAPAEDFAVGDSMDIPDEEEPVPFSWDDFDDG